MTLDAAALAAEYPPQTFGFELKKARGFVPPPGVAALKDSVTLNLALGAHYFFTLVQHRVPTFGLVTDFLSFSSVRDGCHVFHGSSFGDDSEFAGDYSQQFAKFVGIAFMAERADSTWFASLARLWNEGLKASDGQIAFKKRRPTKDGPDYLAAPFDPTTASSKDPLYVVEFKGRAGRVAFSHSVFGDWRKQSRNIHASVDGHEVKLKSWILAFSYAFENSGDRISTLLVEDPWTAREDRPPLEATRRNIGRVVREHIARQCLKFNAGRLAGPVLAGRMPERTEGFPGVFKVRHPALQKRRYIGAFAARGPDGELVWMPEPLTRLPRRLDIEVLDDSPGPFHTAIVRVGPSGDRRVVVYGHGSNFSDAALRRILRSLFDGGGAQLFLGQDATMVRDCMRTGVDRELAGEAFTAPIQFQETADTIEGPGYVQVLRNGAVLADANIVASEEEDSDWWRRPA